MKKYLLFLNVLIAITACLQSECFANTICREGSYCEKENNPDYFYFLDDVEKTDRNEIKGGQRYAIVMYDIYKKDYDSAEKTVEMLIKEYPYLSEGYILLARIKERTGHSNELEEIYTKCIRNCPDDSMALIYRAILYYNQKRYKEAIKDYDTLLSLSDNKFAVVWMEKRDLYFNRAVAKYFDGDLKGALDDYNKAAKIASDRFENDSAFFFNRGICKFDSGDIEGAKDDYQKAVKLNPEAGYVYYDQNRRIKG